MANIQNKKVAVLATHGFEQSELQKPVDALKEAGARVEIVSLKSGSIRGWSGKDWGEDVEVDKTVDSVKAADYDALVLPGGVMNPDTLRMNKEAVAFVSEFMAAGKPVAAICHGPWTLVEAGALILHKG
jgi:protease I